MALFQKEETVFEKKDICLGELNYDSPTGTCYDNVLTYAIPVRKNRGLYLEMRSDKPIDVVIARSDNSVASQSLQKSVCEMGPVDTRDDTEMGLLIGTYPGDRATVSVRMWLG